jgi:hypothetical protein
VKKVVVAVTVLLAVGFAGYALAQSAGPGMHGGMMGQGGHGAMMGGGMMAMNRTMSDLRGAVVAVEDPYGEPDLVVCGGIAVQGACIER